MNLSPTYPKIAIFTFTMNRIEYTKRMLKSLKAFTHVPYDHFIIDNSSTDGTVEYLQSHLDDFAKVTLNSENRGLSVTWNQALDTIGMSYDYIVKVDNDCEILTDDWLAPIVGIQAKLNNKIILSPYVEGLHQHKGGVPRYAKQEIDNYTLGFVPNLGGISLVVPADAYKGFRFNEALPKRGNQDNSFSQHAAKLGYNMAYVEEIKVLHMDTTLGQHEKYPEYFKQAAKERWEVHGRCSILAKPRLKIARKLERIGIMRRKS